MTRITRFLLKRAGLVACMGLLMAGVGGYFTVHLFMNLRTEIEELLPTDARSVLDLNEVKARLESTNNISVLMFSDHVDDSKRFVIDLAKALEKLPKEVSAGIEYRIDNELKFFSERKPLFIETPDLLKIKKYIQDRIHYEVQLYNPLTILENRDFREPKFDFGAIQKKYSGKTDSYTHFPDGFYASTDQKIRVLNVNLPGGAGGIEGAKALKAAVEKAIRDLDPLKYAPDLKIHYTGGVQDLIEEHEALIEDLALSTVVVCVLVGLAMIIYFRSLIGTFCLVSALMVGTLMTFGIAYFEVGYLNANSAFMASIVIGNGINFGVILLARFMEERRKHKAVPHAMAVAVESTFSATIVAAGAAALAYGSLILTSFRGFRQFGIIGLTGMIVCWSTTYLLLPSFMICFYKIGFLRKPVSVHRAWFAEFVAHIVEKHAKAVLIVTAIITVLAVSTLGRINSSIIETDMRKLRNKHSLENGSMHWSKYVDEVFQRYLSPVVILPKNKDHVEAIAEEVRKTKEAEASTTFIVNVSTINDFVPQDQAAKTAALREINRMLPKRIMNELKPKEKELAKELLTDSSLKTFDETSLPELVKSKFREHDGTIGKLVLVEPSLSPELAKSDNLIHFVHSVREAADRIEPGVAVAGTLPVTADMFESIVRDGPKATLFAFVAVLLLVVLLFRDALTIAQCSFALILGVLWLFGYILGFHHKINFLNFIALPITFGIGVDYGVNIFQRYRLEKSEGILNVLRHTGGAVILASMTTIIGYGSLIIASNQAFVSFGQLAILGELTCVFAAVVSLPSLIWFLEERKRKKIAHEPIAKKVLN
jgi:predicted RND superfamily exporter protein